MRKKLLSLFALAFIAMGTFAQSWTAPVRPTPPEGADPVSGEVYRLMNVEAGQFVAGGSSWYTWATSTVLVSDPAAALQYTMTEEFEGSESIGWTFARPDGQFTFVSGSYNGLGEMHVDNPTNPHRYYELLKQPNGYYHIRVAELDDTYGSFMEGWADKCWGWAGPAVAPTNAVYATVNPAEGYYCDWVFGQWTDEELEPIMALYELYRARLGLYNVATEAESYGVDISSYSEIYNGEDIEAMAEAQTAIKEAISAAQKAEIFKYGADGENPPSESNPADVTIVIENYDFTGCSNGNFPGWTIYAPNGGNTWVNGTSYVEYWNGTASNGVFDYYQVLTGLPAGKYTLTASMWNSMNGVAGTFEATSGVYGSTSLGTQYAMVEDDCDNSDLHEYTTPAIILGEGDELRVGVKNIKTMVARWFGVDYIHLTYYGQVSDPWKVTLDQLVEQLEATYIIESVMANTDVKSAYSAALAEAKSATTDYEGQVTKLREAAEALEASVADYERFYNLISNWSDKAADVDGTKWAQAGEDIADKLQEMSEAYDNGTYTVEDIDAAENFVSNTFANIIGELVESGDDITFLLNNPGFDSDFSGWELTEESVSPVWGGAPVTYMNLEGEEVTLTSGNAERYHAKFDMFQTIKNMPAGLFTLSCQAFERDDNGAGIEAELYAILPDGTEKTVKLLNLRDDGSEYQLFNGTQGTDNRPDLMNGTLWVPDGMDGANIYFAEGFYKNFFDFRVDERGDITIGVRTASGGDWVLFDDFKIVYKGDDASAYTSTLERLIDDAEKILTSASNGEKNYTTKSIDDLDAETQTASNLLDNIDTATKDEVTTEIDKLQAAIDYANKSVELIEKLIDTGSYFQGILSSTTVVSSNTELQDLLDAIDAKDGTYSSNEEVEGWIAEMPLKWFAFVLSQEGLSSATEKAPVELTDLIFNPSFDLGNASYWTIEPLGANNQYQSASYTNTVAPEGDPNYNISISGFAECWRDGAVLDDGMIYQTLAAALPAGYYRLECDGHAVAQMGYPDGGIQGAYVTATNGTTYWQTAMGVKEGSAEAEPRHYAVEFESNGTDLITVGLRTISTNANWITGDNFQLFYLGTTAPTAVERIDAATEKKATVIYNLAGQRVQKAVRGLYIINGKKVLVK